MAYANYGATVYCDDEPLHKSCDVTMGQMLGKSYFYPSYIFHYIKKGIKKSVESVEDTMYHAIVGDKEAGIFVCLYKSSPSVIFMINHKGQMEGVPFTYDWEYEWKVDVVVGKVTVHLEGIDEPDGVSCSFTDRKGRKWLGKSAYCYGEGHQEWG